MAKNRNGETIRKLKRKDNRTSHLIVECKTKDCHNEFYVIRGKFGSRKRLCAECFHKNPTGVSVGKRNEVLLRNLGLIS